MPAGNIQNGAYASANTSGLQVLNCTPNVSVPSANMPTAWNGYRYWGIYNAQWRTSEVSGGVNLYMRLALTSGVPATQYFPSSTTTVALPSYTTTPPVVTATRSAGPYVLSYAPGATLSTINVQFSVWKNSAGNTATNNTYGPDTDDTRQGLNASPGSWAALSYYTNPSAQTGTVGQTALSNNQPAITYGGASDDGGSAVTSYTVVWTTTGSDILTTATGAGFGTSSASWAGSFTTNGPSGTYPGSGSYIPATFASNTQYYFRVFSTNAIGPSPYSTDWEGWYYRTINYNGNGGSFAPGTATLYPNNGNSATLADAPTRAGYRFTGWAASTGGTYAAGATYTAPSDVTMTAQWQELKGKIFNGSTWVAIPNVKVHNGSSFVTPTTFKVYDGSTWKSLI